MRKINIPRVCSQRPSGLCATPCPHQMPCGNATSHEYRTDIRTKTGVSKHVTEMRTSVTAGVETAIMSLCQWQTYLLFVLLELLAILIRSY